MCHLPAYRRSRAFSQQYFMENDTKHYVAKSRGQRQVVKNRTQYSCIGCRKRKVKCDRVQPCSACCRRGDGFECTYVASVESRKYMRQAEIIAVLKHKIEKLEKLDSDDQASYGNSPVDEENPALRAINAIAFGSADDVAKIISQLRGKTDLSVSQINSEKDVKGNPDCSKRWIDDESFDNNSCIPDNHDKLRDSEVSVVKRSNSSDNITLSESLDTLEPFQDVFLDMFISHFLLDDNWRHHSGSCRSEMHWLCSVARNMSSLPQSRQALRSISTAYFGKLYGDAQITAIGHSMYGATLATLRQSLSTQSTDSLCTTLILWLFEMINSSTSCGWLHHLYGAEKLFQLKGPGCFASGIEHELFLCFREHGIIASMTKLQHTYLSDHNWKTLPWSSDPSSKDILHQLLDHVADAASLLSLHSRIEMQSLSGYISSNEADDARQQLVSQTKDVISHLRNWKVQWADNYPYGQPYEAPILPQNKRQSWDPEGFQLPLCPSPSFDSHGCSEKNIYYPDFIMAHIMILYYGSVVLLSRIGHPFSLISDQETEAICRRICRSVEYHIFFAPRGRGATALMFALRQAYLWFPVDRPERHWLEELFVWMREMVPLAVNQLPHPPLSDRDMVRSFCCRKTQFVGQTGMRT